MDVACPRSPHDTETLAFEVHEGPTHNLFYRRGPIAAHVLATSGARPRVLVAFPAGNTGAGIWFEPCAEPLAITVEGPLAPAHEGAMRGVAATIAIAANEIHVERAILGSVRVLRAAALHADAEAGAAHAEAPEAGELCEPAEDSRGYRGPRAPRSSPDAITFARTMADDHRVALHVAPLGATVARVDASGRATLTAPPGETIRVTITAVTDEPALTPVPSSELLVEGVSAEAVALETLAFLAYEEKLLAGSWRFLTYFGRDTLLAVRLLMPVLRPAVVEAGLGAVLDRISHDGVVAHEESIGEWAALERAAGHADLDRSMIDDDFLVAPVAAEYLLRGAGRARAAAFLARRTPSGDTYAESLARNLALVIRRAEPFAKTQDARTLIALGEGRAAGDWRDSEEGLGGGRVPFNVNAALVPAALEAAASLFASALLGEDATSAERAATLAKAYASAGDRFRVTVPAAEARRRVAAYADAMGVDPGPAVASIDGDVVFPALALDEAGAPIPVMHTDDGFVLLFTDPAPSYLEEAASRIVRPFPAGLRTPAGLVVANPAYCTDRSIRDLFTPAHYHGTVVWSWHHALLAAGLRRQLAREDLPSKTRAALSEARSTLDAIIRASSEWRTSELWSIAAKDGALERVPFGAARAHHDESNAAQLWSTVYLALDTDAS